MISMHKKELDPPITLIGWSRNSGSVILKAASATDKIQQKEVTDLDSSKKIFFKLIFSRVITVAVKP